MSAQIELMQWSMRLQPGQCVKLDNELIRKAAWEDIESALDRMAGVRDADVKGFVAKIKANWGITLDQNPLSQQWTMCRPNEAAEPPAKIFV